MRLGGILAGQVELALQIQLQDLHVAHGHAISRCPSSCMRAGRLTRRRIISEAKEWRKRAGDGVGAARPLGGGGERGKQSPLVESVPAAGAG